LHARRLVGWLLVCILALVLGACGAAPAEEEPAEAPTEEAAEEEEEPAEEEVAEPTTTAAAVEPPVEVAFEGETSVTGTDSTASGVLSVESLGVGTVDASAPAELMLGQSGTVRVEITPLYDPEEIEVETYVTVTAVEDPVAVLNFYDELRLYSIMGADISAPGFDVETATPRLQRLSAEAPALWVWNVVPREWGRRSVTVSISVPIIIDGEVQDISTSPLRTIEFIIDVAQPPTITPSPTVPPTVTPVPTPTPAPTPTLVPTPMPDFLSRTLDEMGPEILAAIVLGVLGAIGSFVLRQFRRRGGGGQ
jgi:hypothetical protein